MTTDQQKIEWFEFGGNELAVTLWNKSRKRSDYDAEEWKKLSIELAASPSTILSLLSQISALQGEVERLRGIVKDAHTVLEIAAQGKNGKQHVYLESRIGHFVECQAVIKACESVIAPAPQQSEVDHG